MRRTATVLVLTLVTTWAASPLFAAGLSDLAWMTGDWQGPAGPGRTLEEHWLAPSGGSMAALVRMTTAEATPMVELIVVEEDNDSVVLRLQQWNPGYQPRSEGPQVMKLVSVEENQVWFEAETEGGLKKLGYSRDGDAFSIHGVTATGAEFTIELSAMK